MKIELLWFEECPCHRRAEELVRDVLQELDVDVPVQRVQVEDEASGRDTVFPGSPTVRVNGRDVEPGWRACPDCTPRCRLYQTEHGIGCLPERDWIAAAVREALSEGV